VSLEKLIASVESVRSGDDYWRIQRRLVLEVEAHELRIERTKRRHQRLRTAIKRYSEKSNRTSPGNADRLRRLVSDRRLILVSLAVAALGFLIVALDAGFAATVAGFAIIGLGTGAVVPCGFALAVSDRGFSAAAALSTVALFGSLARLPAPLAMGAIANYFSLAGAFSLFAILLALAVGAMRLFVSND